MATCHHSESIRYIGADADPFVENDEDWRQRPLFERVWYIDASFPASLAADEMADLFSEKAAVWRKETMLLSSTSEIVLHPAYQDIIGMGEKVLPYILRDLEANGGRWFWALRHITQQNPVPPEDMGKIRAMREAWLDWGRQQNYL